jgi:hypothetical protein
MKRIMSEGRQDDKLQAKMKFSELGGESAVSICPRFDGDVIRMGLGITMSMMLLLLLSARALSGVLGDSCSFSNLTIQQISHDSVNSFVPQILAEGDTVHLLWFGDPTITGGSIGQGIQYCHSFNGGNTFTAAIQLASYDSGSGNAGKLAVAGSDVYVAYYKKIPPPEYTSIAIMGSSNAGETWNQLALLGDYNLWGFTAIDSSLYVYYGYRDSVYHIPIYGGIIASHNRGRSFSIVSTGIYSYAMNYPHLFATPGVLHMYFEKGFQLGNADFGYPEIAYRRSTDAGGTWTSPEILSVNDSINSQIPQMGSDGDRNLYIIWNDGKYGGFWTGTILLRHSTDNGASWLPEQIISRPAEALFSGVSAGRGTVAVVWDTDSPFPKSIQMRVSNNEAGSWCPIARIDADEGHVGEPAVSVGQLTAQVAWVDDSSTVSELYERNITGVTTGVVIQNHRTPRSFALKQNYPNPFNSGTHIEYYLPSPEHVTLRIYNVLGQEVESLVNGPETQGTHSLNWSAEGFPSGVYYYSLRTARLTETRKLVLLR